MVHPRERGRPVHHAGSFVARPVAFVADGIGPTASGDHSSPLRSAIERFAPLRPLPHRVPDETDRSPPRGITHGRGAFRRGFQHRRCARDCHRGWPRRRRRPRAVGRHAWPASGQDRHQHPEANVDEHYHRDERPPRTLHRADPLSDPPRGKTHCTIVILRLRTCYTDSCCRVPVSWGAVPPLLPEARRAPTPDRRPAPGPVRAAPPVGPRPRSAAATRGSPPTAPSAPAPGRPGGACCRR